MAEIKIEKKKPVLLWILVGLGILAAFIYLVTMNDGEATEKLEDTTDLIGVIENDSTVAAFVTFAEADTNKMTMNHAYTHALLFKLVDATNAMAYRVGYEVRTEMDSIRALADMITVDSLDTTHANNIRKATDMLTSVIQNIQLAKYPTLTVEAVELGRASSLINPDVLTLDQKDAVKLFFRKAADILKKMN
jgi:hypothetical protein